MSGSLDMSKIKWHSLRQSGSRSVKVQRMSAADLSAARTNATSVDSVPHRTFCFTSALKPVHCTRHWRRLAVRLPTACAWQQTE